VRPVIIGSRTALSSSFLKLGAGLQSKNEELVRRRGKSGVDSGGADSDSPTQWARVRARLRDEFGEAAFRSWLRAMTLFEVADGRVREAGPAAALTAGNSARNAGVLTQSRRTS